MNQSNITGLGINIKAKDIAASRLFYESVGFTPVFAYGDDEFLKSLPKGGRVLLQRNQKGFITHCMVTMKRSVLLPN